MPQASSTFQAASFSFGSATAARVKSRTASKGGNHERHRRSLIASNCGDSYMHFSYYTVTSEN
jgi:hypothetical protein